ncbi:hypothetical protein BFP70_15535 [Thioclava sp. SK-1]|uniref:sarcosine oxidase subunit gamma n=1 Tax=Thioclava sp. SK-1 TaxID=1889770 RepID=UPI00082485C1|nr:sarcosine oxidase subunit gamma family protein [Thioclava sp. SK-1]OCX61432.1 hypothetical protein BFP70_15535 [Thioclava sp. SK-1]
MSEPVSALNGRSYDGFACVVETGLQGMITIRSDLGSKPLSKALKSLGVSVPKMRSFAQADDVMVAWMSPDELLLLCDHARARSLTAQLEQALAGTHALVVDVSDARAMFTVTGARAQEVVMKLSPIDFATLADDEIRRTRTAQVNAAVWRSGADQLSLVCFRSVAGYVMGLLEVSARKGGEIF